MNVKVFFFFLRNIFLFKNLWWGAARMVKSRALVELVIVLFIVEFFIHYSFIISKKSGFLHV